MARRPTITIVVLVLAGLLVVAAAVFAGTAAPPPPKTLELACAKNGRGKLQYVAKPKFCKPSRGELVRLPEDHPVVACRLNNNTSLRSAKLPPPAFKSDQPGMVFKVDDAKACNGPKYPNSTAVTFPRPKKTRFCAGKRRGTLRQVRRFTACTELERRVLLPAYDPPQPNRPPRANNNAATTDNDTPKAIAVLANDSDADGDDLKVASLNLTDTDGKVTKNPNGTVTYDPDGQFDSLGKGESAQDSFKYKANDGTVDSNTATVTVTVTGSNQAPVLGGVESTPLAYNTDDAATPITSSLTVSDPDDTQLAGAAVSITGGFVAGKDTLSFTPQLGITGTYNSGTGVLTLTGDASVSDYQTALRDVKYSAAPDTPSGSRIVSFQADDGEANNHASNVVTRDITVTNSDVAPTDITLSPSSIDENGSAGDDVGTLSTTDPDAGDTHTYSLVTGTGSADNGSFQITGDTVEAKTGFDFETKSSYSIRVRTDDGQGGTLEEQLTITVNDVNEAPTDLALSDSSVDENQPSGTTVGTLSSTDPESGDTHTYSLVAGTGSGDNGSFTIDGSTLKTNAVFDFESDSSYSIRVRTTDGGGNTFEEQLTVSVTDLNESPTDLALSPSSVPEGQPSGTTVGSLSTTDPDAGDSHTYSLVSGTGSDDNGSFTIDGSSLKTNAVFDRETKSSYSIRVRTTDALGLTYEEAVTVTVSDANDTPTDIALSNDSVAENAAQGTDVGTLSTTDQDGGSHTYSLVSGTGSTDNGSFQINGSTLEVKTPLNFEAGSTRSVRIQTDDGSGGTFSKQFTITVTDVNEAPTDIGLSPSTVAENQPTGTTVGTLSSTDPESGDTHTYTLVSGTGSGDNGSFTIDGTSLKTNAVFNFEADASYSIRVRTDDGNGNTFEEQLTVGISDVNETPTDLALNDQSIAENAGSAAAVGTFSTTDPDAGDSFTYSLVSGTGDTDNGDFQVSGSTLQAKNSLDFETDSSYSVRVRTTDALGLSYEEAFTITVTDANDAPTDISLSSTSFTANTADATVGTLSSTDQDAGATHSYALVTGAGDTDNGSFTIDGSTLKTDGSLPAGNYSVRIQTSDGAGGTFSESFTITGNPNATPTDIALSNDSVAENTAQGTDVGTLSTTDADGGDTHTYSLVSGTGDTDNGSFQINGSTLEVKTPLNFEAGSTRSIRIRTNDGKGGTFEEQFTITVTDANDAPTDIALSSSSINENVAANSTVGTLSSTDQDTGDTHTYSLVSGTGDTDNSSFTVDGTSLKINASPNYEAKSSYSVRIQTNDGTATFQEQFTITINDVNEFPTDIALSPSSVSENQLAPATVGTFTTTDPDGGGTFTYSLVTGTGSTDNGSFQISGNTLQTNAVFDYETKSSYSIRVKVTDGNGGDYEEAMTVTVTDVNDPPTDIALSPSSVNENVAAGSTVGTLSSTDQDAGATHAYTFATGAGDTDNAAFTIDGTSLKISASPNFEAKSSYAIRVKTDDGAGGTFEEQLTVTVNNVNETPTDLALSPASIDENLASGTEVGAFSTTDPDTADTFTYTKVSGTGDTNNASFTIDGNKLKTAASFNYEAKNSYTVRIRTTDAGGAFYEEAFTVSINDVNEAPVPGGDTYNGVGNTEFILSDSGTTKTSTQAAKEISGSVLTNDTDPEAQTLTTTPQNDVTTNHISGSGRVTIDNAGHFNYTPPTGVFTGSDSFSYTVSDGTLTSQGTVTVNLANQVWYVKNNAGAGGTGRSTDPFDTIGEAETAHSGTGGTTFVYTGNGTTSGLDTGFALETNQRLLGDRVALVVGGDTLVGAQGGNGPTLTDTGADVVTLASGSTVSGLVADPGTGGGGVSGGAGVNASTIDKVRITDTNSPTGNQPGLELDGTGGTIAVSDLVVNNANASGVRLNANTGTVNFADAGTISITTAGAKGLDANSTNMGSPSKFDDITVTGSAVGAVNLDTTSGTTSFGDLSLTTSGSATAAFRLKGASTVNVPTGGTDNINADGGPAVDQSGATDAALTFDNVSSTNSTTTGIALGYVGGSGSFVAGSGDIKGATTFSVDVNGGNGTVNYPGGIGDPGAGTNDGNADAARIQNRTGGTVTLSGNIDDDNDGGGGITLAGNNSGTSSTSISGTSKKINTTAGGGNGIVMGTSPNHTLTVAGGNLEIDTTTGKGLEATGGGTIHVAGTGNSIATTTGTPVNISGTTIGASGIQLHDVSSNGAANGIVLSNTGSVAGLSVTGDNLGSGTSGGTIANSTGASPNGRGISLNNTKDAFFSNVAITSPQHAGVKGALVDGFTFKNGSISSAGAAHTDGKDAAFAFNDTTGGANQNLTGVVAIFGNSVTTPYGGGIDIFNYLGTISDATITGNTIISSSSASLSNEDGISIQLQGTSSGAAKLTKATINNNTVTNFPSGNGIVVGGGNSVSHTAPPTDMGIPSGNSPGTGTNIVTINNNIIHGDPATKMNGEGILIGPNGRGQSNFTVSGNDIENVKGVGIGAGGSGDGTNNASITNNDMSNLNNIAGNIGLSIGVGRNQQSNLNFVDGGTFNQIVTGNTTSATTGPGFLSRITNSNTTQNLRVQSNNFGNPTTATTGMRIDVGTSNDATLDPTLCAQIGGAGALGNTSGTGPPTGGGNTFPGILLFKRSTSATTYVFGIVGLAPSPANPTQTETFVTGNNPNSATGGGFYAGKKVSADAGDNFTSCTLPF